MGRPLKSQLYLGENSPHQIQATVWGTNDTEATAGYLTRQNSDSKFLATTENGTSLVSFVETAPAAKGQATVKIFPVATGGGNGAIATANLLVNSATLVSGGTGYTANANVTLSGGIFQNAATIHVATVSGQGAIETFTVNTVANQNYTSLPSNVANVAVTGDGGTGASFDVNFGIESLAVIHGGSGYTNNAIVVLDGAASAPNVTVNVTAGVVTSFTVNSAGGGFTEAPTPVVEDLSGTTEYVKHLASYRVITQEGNTYRWLVKGATVPSDFLTIKYAYLDTL